MFLVSPAATSGNSWFFQSVEAKNSAFLFRGKNGKVPEVQESSGKFSRKLRESIYCVPSMHVEDALRYIEELFAQRGRRLNDVQRAVFRGSWLGKSYKEIRRDCRGCSLGYITKDVGPTLWNQLTQVLGEEVTKKNLQGPVERSQTRPLPSTGDTLAQPPVQSSPQPPHSQPITSPLSSPLTVPTPEVEEDNPWADVTTRQDWDFAPDVSQFCGRKRELEELKHWVTLSGCRLIALYGMGGVGKTDLSVKLAQQVRDQFDCVIWRSLRRWRSLHRPPFLDELVADLNQFLSNQQNTGSDLSQLMHHLSHHHCLIVLDGFESILQGGVHYSSYKAGYESYGELLLRIGGSAHQSCFLLTSREKPQDFARMEGEARPVRSYQLEGLGELGCRQIFSAKGSFSGSESDWNTLIRRYVGNPLALNVIATRVWEVFDGEVTRFLDEIEQETPIFGELCEVLNQQFERLSDLERTILGCLAAYHEPAEVAAIQSLVEPLSRMQLQEGLQSLLRRSLIELDSSRYSLHPLMMEYVLRSQKSGAI